MRYIGRKLGMMIITIILVSFFVFLSFELIAGDPATSMLGMNATPEAVEALREEMGLNEPFFARFFDWGVRFIQGDMGVSYSYKIPVSEMIGDKIPITITLTAMAFFILVIFSIPIGIYTAKHEGSFLDRMIYITNQVTMAIPPFFLGILITYILGLVLHLFTPGGYVSYDVNLGAFFYYLLFPAIAIALPKIAMTVKLLRSSILEQAKMDYVKTAYSRGNNSKGVLYHHVLKNAFIPTMTFLGMVLTDMVAGSIIIEQVFGIPGLGRILLTSISNRDYPVVQAIIVCIAAFVILVNFVVDVLYQVVDPRIQNE